MLLEYSKIKKKKCVTCVQAGTTTHTLHIQQRAVRSLRHVIYSLASLRITKHSCSSTRVQVCHTLKLGEKSDAYQSYRTTGTGLGKLPSYNTIKRGIPRQKIQTGKVCRPPKKKVHFYDTVKIRPFTPTGLEKSLHTHLTRKKGRHAQCASPD